MERQERTPNFLLRQERKRRGWTQRKLADAINSLREGEGNGQRGAATSDMVRKWEQGIHPPSPFYVSRLCEIFGCTADQLGIGEARLILPSLLVAPPTIDNQNPSLWLMRLITLIDHWRSPHFHDLQCIVNQEILRMNRTKLLRREALFALAALPTFLVTLNVISPIEEILARYAASIAACWHLYFDGGAEEIKPYLALHLPRLASLAKVPSKYQRGAAILASQAYQLEWFLALQDRDFGKALFATQESFTYGEIADNPSLLLASRVRRAHVYLHLKNPTQQMRHHEAALQYAPNVSPLLKSWINMVIAENHASLHRVKEADYFIKLARDHFPDHPEEDANASYIPVNSYTLSKYETLTYLHMQQPEKALQATRDAEKELPETLLPRRAELLNHQLMALCDLGELEEACALFEIAERGARQSKLRYNEVCEVYSLMCMKWPNERQVLELEELLRR
jgi:transcriptional regulator with XRE-family HTH domain